MMPKNPVATLTICLPLFALAALSFGGNDNQSATNDVVNSFEAIFGVAKGKRRNHAKGFCFDGVLIPVGNKIQRYSVSPLFVSASKVIGRLSHKGGNPSAPDNTPSEYGMGLSIVSVDGEDHRMSMNTLDFFPVATADAFAELMRAKADGVAAVKAFKEKNIDLRRFKDHMAKKEKVLTPYEGSTYNSINSFYLVDAENARTAVRWSFVPETPMGIVSNPSQNFFFDNMQRNLLTQTIAWNMVVTLANTDDAVDNPAIPWRGRHNQILAAKLYVISIAREADGSCDTINFDPMVMSRGFEASSDPLLQARSKAYAVSFSARMSEKHVSGGTH